MSILRNQRTIEVHVLIGNRMFKKIKHLNECKPLENKSIIKHRIQSKYYTKNEFSMKDFFSKCDQIRRKFGHIN